MSINLDTNLFEINTNSRYPIMEHSLSNGRRLAHFLFEQNALDHFNEHWVSRIELSSEKYDRFIQLFKQRCAPDFTKFAFHDSTHSILFNYNDSNIVTELDLMGFVHIPLNKNSILMHKTTNEVFAFHWHSSEKINKQYFWKHTFQFFKNYIPEEFE